MTDDSLIELIDKRPPEELSGAEPAEIRARLKNSSAVREAFAGRVRLDQALHQTVGHVRCRSSCCWPRLQRFKPLARSPGCSVGDRPRAW